MLTESQAKTVAAFTSRRYLAIVKPLPRFGYRINVAIDRETEDPYILTSVNPRYALTRPSAERTACRALGRQYRKDQRKADAYRRECEESFTVKR